MRVEASVGETDEPFVKPFLVGTALVADYEKHQQQGMGQKLILQALARV